MIKVQELRIGNHVIYKSIQMAMKNENGDWENYEEPHQIHTIEVDADHLKNMEKNASHYQPIPLTEEWLKRLDFKKDVYGDFSISNSVTLLSNGIIIIHIGLATAIDIECKYLHQLQNIIFALTGKELVIKEVSNEQ